MIPATALALLKAVEASMPSPTSPLSRHLKMIAESGKLDEHEAWTVAEAASILEADMALKPRYRVKAKGRPVFLGKDFEAAADASGSMKVKPKRKPPGRTLQQEYASRNRKKWKAAK